VQERRHIDVHRGTVVSMGSNRRSCNYFVEEQERERERETERERQRERDRETERERYKGTEWERGRMTRTDGTGGTEGEDSVEFYFIGE